MSDPSIFMVMDTLKQAKIYFKLDAFDPDVLTLTVSVPGQRWEIQFFPDRSPEIEFFKSEGQIDALDSNALLQLVSRWRD
jgi:hypothetical protein